MDKSVKYIYDVTIAYAGVIPQKEVYLVKVHMMFDVLTKC